MRAASQEVASRARGVNPAQAEARVEPVQPARREDEPTLVPAVDIFEDANGITVQAEMPGVSKERLNIQADRNTLLIEGDIAIQMPQAMEALYADVHATKYRRPSSPAST